MDINGIRRKNYMALMERFRMRPDQAGLSNHGFLTRFAAVAGVSVRYLSHINNNRKNIGDAIARQIESGLNLPYGWLDNDHESELESNTDTEKVFASTIMRLYRENPEEIQAMLMRYMVDRLEAKANKK